MVYSCQQLAAPNDRNGNPRRLWVVCFQSSFDPSWHHPGQDAPNGSFVPPAVLTEGYKGRAVVAQWFAESKRGARAKMGPLLELPSINVTATEYRNWIRFARESDSIELQEN